MNAMSSSYTPPSSLALTVRPLCSKTFIIETLLAKTSAVKALQAVLLGRVFQKLEHQRGQAPALILLVDDKGHIGIGPVFMAHVAGLADDMALARRTHQGHYGHGLTIVDVDVLLHLGVGACS